MLNHDDELSNVGSLERETLLAQRLEREALFGRINPDEALGD